jgi:hypothetical protein
VVGDPETHITRVLERFGGELDVANAVAAVKPENRTQDAVQSDSVEPDLAAVFDELYATIRDGRPLSGAFLQTLNATNRRMLPTLTELQTKVMRSMAQRGGRARPMGVEGLPDLS